MYVPLMFVMAALLALPAAGQSPLSFDQGIDVRVSIQDAQAEFKAPEVGAEAPPGVLYRRVLLADKRSLDVVREALGSRWAELLRFNRIDEKHARPGTVLIIPDPFPEWPALTPFPRDIPSFEDVKKVLLVSLRVQAFAAYENGVQVRWGPTSTGARESPTKQGVYFTNFRARKRNSTIDESWILEWYFNLDSLSGRSLHYYTLPGRPASHGCIRLAEVDAQWVYEWADEWQVSKNGREIMKKGTPVVVFGEYDYGSPPPWKRLPEDPDAQKVTPREIERFFAQLALAGGP